MDCTGSLSYTSHNLERTHLNDHSSLLCLMALFRLMLKMMRVSSLEAGTIPMPTACPPQPGQEVLIFYWNTGAPGTQSGMASAGCLLVSLTHVSIQLGNVLLMQRKFHFKSFSL